MTVPLRPPSPVRLVPDLSSLEARLAGLRASLEKPGLEDANTVTPLGHAAADLCLKGGLRHGVLHEVFATAGHDAPATGFALGLAARVAARRHLLWIRQVFSARESGDLSPTGLSELGLDPSRLLLVSVGNADDGLRAAHDALSCGALGAVLVELRGNPKALDLVASRKLTLVAAQTSVTPFFLRLDATPAASTAETRWLVQAASSHALNGDWGHPVFAVSLLRNRHGKTGQWIMEWNCDERIFKNTAAAFGTLVSAPADGPAATAGSDAA